MLAETLHMETDAVSLTLKARTHTPIFGEYALESADSELESADSSADSSIDS